MRKTTRARQLLAGNGTVVLPGVYDALSARLAERAGFAAAGITGYGVEATLLGNPDIGLITLPEIVEQARRIAAAVDIPIFCDAETGFGGVASVYRTVREFEAAGVAGIHVEDQTSPKRCGGMAGRSVVPLDEMIAKVRAMVEARQDPDFVIIARTDARAPLGVDEAIRRLNAYRRAGADVLMAAEHYEPDELARLARSVDGPLMIVGGFPGWRESTLPVSEYHAMGVKVVLYALSPLLAAARALRDFMAMLHAKGTVSDAELETRGIALPELEALLGLGAWRTLEERCRT